MLKVRLIGTFAIEYDGRPVTLSSRVAQSLFAYLILTSGTFHRREKLAGMFWPQITEEKARAYLRHELWRIRRTLASADCLLSNGIAIAFDSSAEYWLDAEILEKLADSASADELIAALSIYQGELLPGFYDEWVVLERDHLQAVYEGKMARLLELLESEKRWHQILEWAERRISLGHPPEAAYRALMVAYNALGDRAKVASTYERCAQALRALDLEPSEEMRALAFTWPSSLNIPVSLTSFIGRKKELKEIVGRISKYRLVTLTGSGGVGKTRLSIQVVLEVLNLFPDGIWFFDLAFLSDPALVPNALASLLGVRDTANSRLSILDLLKGYLRSRTALLIFDNCEHLIESCAQLADSLLQACPTLHILATSREVLRVAGEIPYRVPSLEIPRSHFRSTVDVLANTESVRLFIERAAVASSGFVLGPQNILIIAQICQRLDGIPLAIELAAARVHTLSVEQILNRLDDRFNLLKYSLHTSLTRHQTLRETIEWSYSLLSEQERILFRRLAVFIGGWTLEAAEEVCSGMGIESGDILDLLSQLVHKSLVLVETSNDGIRYRRLGTVRQYARERFSKSGEEEKIRTRHLEYFLQFAEQAHSGLRGPAQSEWYARLNHERDNLRAALECADERDIEAGLFLAGRLHRYWENFDLSEGVRWLDKFLEKPASKSYPLARAKALVTKAWLMLWTQEFGLAHTAAQESLGLCRAHGDKYGEIDSLLALGISDYNTWSVELKELYQQAHDLSKSLGDQWRRAQALVRLSWIDNDYHSRISYLEQAVTLFKRVGDLELATAQMIWLGNQEAVNGNLQSAKNWLDEAVRTSQHLNIKGTKADILYLDGIIALIEGDYQRARVVLQEAAALQEELGHQWSLPWTYARLGYIALREGNLTQARHIFANTAQMFQKDQFVNGVVFTLEGIASLSLEVGKPERAARLIGWADVTREKIGDTRPLFEQADVDRDVAAIIGKVGNTPFEEAYNAGRVMTLDEAFTFALEEL